MKALRNFFRIVVELIRRDIRTRYAGSLIGMFWSVGVPALNALVLSAVFSVLMSGRMGIQYESVPFALFYFAGFAPWVLFTEASGRAPSVIVDNAAIVKRLPFPLEALCVQVVGSAIISHLVVLGVTGLLMLVHGLPVTANLSLLPLLLCVTLVLTLGIVLALAALAVFVRDLVQLVPVGLNLLFFLTPILYPPSMVISAPASVRFFVLDLNPWHHIVEGYRVAILGTSALDLWGLGYAAFMAIRALVGGLALFRRLRPAFADVL
jgi:lipopolysaccharide transport system permease protein/teichoic acid transport system permease protein